MSTITRVATDEWLERNGCTEPFPSDVFADLKAIFEAPLPPAPSVPDGAEK